MMTPPMYTPPPRVTPTPSARARAKARRAGDMSERAALLGRATSAATSSSSSRASASTSASEGVARHSARATDEDIERGDDGVRDRVRAFADVRACGASSRATMGERASSAYDRHVRGGLSGAATCVLAVGAFAVACACGRAASVGGARAVSVGAALGDGVHETANLNAFTGSAFDHATGVALNGWLQLEDWFYANGETSIVDSDLGQAQGAVFPPMFTSSEALGFKWASEGELTMKLVEKLGEDAAVQALAAHRSDFLTNSDLEKIKGLGYQTLRVPITWAAFQGTDEKPTVLVHDPVYKDRAFVSLDKKELTSVLRTVHRVTGSTILLDMHNMPGGSSAGTYNGVFPHRPAFWDNEKTQILGLHSARKMLEWYNDLAEADKDFVDGFTLLNEPAHMMPEKKEVMLNWMAKAIYMYREIVVRPRESMKRPVPKLYVNLMNTAGIAQNEYGKLMASWFDETELDHWAVLDVHFYLAWGNTGCESGCAFKCSDPIPKIAESVRASAAAFIGSIKRPAETYGVKHFSIGEWSLATHRDSSKGCSDSVVSQTIYKSQLKAFKTMGAKNFFWGWKMPSAGLHENFWSMDVYQTRVAASQLGEQTSVTPRLGGAPTNQASLGNPPEFPSDDKTMSVVSSLLDRADVRASSIVEEAPLNDVRITPDVVPLGVDAKDAAQPVAGQPAIVPVATTSAVAPVHVELNPTQVVATAQPARPIAAQPAQTVVEHRAQPVVEQPAQTGAAQPAQPVVEKPPQIVVEQPVQSVVEQPAQQAQPAQTDSKFAPVHVELNPGQAVQAQALPLSQPHAVATPPKPVPVQVVPAQPVAPVADAPVVYASQRHDGSFWATAYGLDALTPPSVHKNAFMIEDSKDIDETEYYEEPREVIAKRTGRALPTYADDAKDNLHQHRSTYSMHDAKNMKTGKISYDLFSRASTGAGSDDDIDMDNMENDDADTDFDVSNLMVGSDDFTMRPSERESFAEDSTERVPSRSSSSHSKHKSHSDDNDEYNDDENVAAAGDDEENASWTSLAGRDLEVEESARSAKSSSKSRTHKHSSSHRHDDDDD